LPGSLLPAIGDGAAANVGSGALGAGRVAVTIGTTSALRAVLPGSAPPVPPGLWAYLVDRETALVGGALTEGGNLAAWLRSILRLGDPSTLEARLAALEPGSHGLTLLPTLAGERSPGYRPGARGAVASLSLAATPLEIMRAGLEAVALRLADLAERLGGVVNPQPLYGRERRRPPRLAGLDSDHRRRPRGRGARVRRARSDGPRCRPPRPGRARPVRPPRPPATSLRPPIRPELGGPRPSPRGARAAAAPLRRARGDTVSDGWPLPCPDRRVSP
jgi:hypothetical protein